jgi:hypothetical protein
VQILCGHGVAGHSTFRENSKYKTASETEFEIRQGHFESPAPTPSMHGARRRRSYSQSYMRLYASSNAAQLALHHFEKFDLVDHWSRVFDQL